MRLSGVWFLGLFLVSIMVAKVQAGDLPLPMGVFDFQSADDSSKDLAPKISALLTAELSLDDSLILVERAELDKVLGEQELGLSGAVSEATAGKVGQLTGAKVLVTGRIMKFDKDTVVIAKVIGTETGRLFAQKEILPGSGTPAAPIAALARQIKASVTAHRAELLAKPDDTAARLEALKAKLAGRKLPTVSVTVPEQHFGRPVIDPAAETELGVVLQQCGFPLVDAKTRTAEIEIIGEAFSERALQKGALISCKARLEIKARRPQDNALFSVDRQVNVSVDLSEHIAAKNALQAAGRELALRLALTLAPQ